MTDKIKSEIQKMPLPTKVYAGTVIPLWLSFTIYMLIGIPVLPLL
jgi:hypothetical protein